MAITLQSAVRVNPVPCTHFDLSISVDGNVRHVVLAASDLDTPPTDEEIQMFLRMWGRYHRNKGRTLAQLIGQDIIADIA